MAANGREIIQTYDKLNSEAGTHQERWERMAPYISPSRVGIQTKYQDGQKTPVTYDSTMLMAAELLAYFLAGHTITPGKQWFDWRPADRKIADNDDAREWIEECRDITFRNAANSMFYAEGPETILDTTGFGTGCMITEESAQPVNRTVKGFRGFNVITEKTGRFLISEGVNGLVDTLYRKRGMSARVIRDKWGDGNLPIPIRRALAEGQPNKIFEIVHAIYPRPKGQVGSDYGAKGKPFASCWVDYDSKEIVSEGGYDFFPAAIPRYTKTPGEVFGRGRGDIAFPDSWTLNTAKRMSFEDWALKIRPPTAIAGGDTVIGTLKLIPAGTLMFNTHGRPIRDVAMPWETGSRPEVSQINEEALRNSINGIFFVQHILSLMEIHKSEMTVFEYARKLELLFKLVGPTYARLEYEWLAKQLDIMFAIQFEAGAFPPPPPIFKDTSGLIDVMFLNPLAKAQRSGDTEALALTINDLAPLANKSPEILDWIDIDRIGKEVPEVRGLPARWTRSDKQVAALRSERHKQNEMDLQLERTSQMAEAAGKAAPALQILQGGKQ
jgi:hypothetical protein